MPPLTRMVLRHQSHPKAAGEHPRSWDQMWSFRSQSRLSNESHITVLESTTNVGNAARRRNCPPGLQPSLVGQSSPFNQSYCCLGHSVILGSTPLPMLRASGCGLDMRSRREQLFVKENSLVGSLHKHKNHFVCDGCTCASIVTSHTICHATQHERQAFSSRPINSSE